MKTNCSAKVFLEVNDDSEVKRLEVKGSPVSIMALLCTTFDECPAFLEVVEEAIDFYKRGKDNGVKVEIELS